MRAPTNTISLLLGLLALISLATSTITVSNLAIETIGGNAAAVPSSGRLSIPVNSVLGLTWTFVDTETQAASSDLYYGTLVYTNPESIIFDYWLPQLLNYSELAAGTQTLVLPAGFSSVDTGAISLSVFKRAGDDNEAAVSTTTTPNFDVNSLCDTAYYCGAQPDAKCDAYTSTCTCANGYGGTRCETTPCEMLNCVTNNLQTNFVCNDNEAKCECKTGYSGTRCEIADACQTVSCNGGFFDYIETTAEINCNNNCTCPGLFEDKNGFNDPDSKGRVEGGCTKCSLDCQNGGSIIGDCISCSCPLGYGGTNCELFYAVGTLQMTGLAPYISYFPLDGESTSNLSIAKDHARSRFLTQLQSLLVLISGLQSSEVSIGQVYTKGNEVDLPLTILINFNYGVVQQASGKKYAPRLSAIKHGWELIMNDLSTTGSSILKTFTDSMQDTYLESVSASSSSENDQLSLSEDDQFQLLATTSGVTIANPGQLWDGSCKTIYDESECSTGAWPFETSEPKTKKENKVKQIWWVIVVAAVCGALAIAGIAAFVIIKCLGGACFVQKEQKYENTEAEDDDNSAKLQNSQELTQQQRTIMTGEA